MTEQTFHRSPEEVVSLYSDMVYKIALSQVKHKEDAEDIFQEVFLNYMKCNKQFTSEEHEKSYLITMTVNSCKKHFRSAWFRHRADYSELAEVTQGIEIDEEAESIYAAILQLPAKYRLVIHLFYYEELSIAQISRSLNIKESTIKSQLMRGRALLKDILTGGADYER